MQSTETNRLLIEIRDAQREHLALYRRVTEESLEMQRLAVLRQEQAVKLSQRAIVAIAAAVICLLVLFVLLRAENY